ncbi:MAG TPA: hypothetical protein VHX49_15775 [Candidatus Acidoferrales bacterium]|nr:hypothetical protein [Candidatus Acidoferrales bacterium]
MPKKDASKLSVVCDGLLFRIFPQSADASERRLVVAFTSAHAASGVTEVTRMLAKALRQGGTELAICLSYRSLLQQGFAASNSGLHAGPNVRDWSSLGTGYERGNWHAIQELLASSIERLRLQYRYVLIDCAPITETQDAIRLAPLVDGVVLVVEANRTRREQIVYAERNIESAGGRILGHVLNKRTYAIPAWFHRVMTAVGV